MAEWTGASTADFTRVGVMLARWTHPVWVSIQWTTRRNACWELCVTCRTRRTPTQTSANKTTASHSRSQWQ